MNNKFYIMTDEEYEKGTMSAILSKLEPKLIERILRDREDNLSQALHYMVRCESPIERMLAYEMWSMGLTGCCYFNPNVDILEIVNQGFIKHEGKTYRIDFAIYVNYPNANKQQCFLVECDGHDFHEKTKEQVRKNNQRDRDLKALGYEVIHFSGSEVYKSAHDCVRELLRLITSFSK